MDNRTIRKTTGSGRISDHGLKTSRDLKKCHFMPNIGISRELTNNNSAELMKHTSQGTCAKTFKFN